MRLNTQDFLTDDKLNNCTASATGVYIKMLCLMFAQEIRGCLIANEADLEDAQYLYKQYLEMQQRQDSRLGKLYIDYELSNYLSPVEQTVLSHVSNNLVNNLSKFEQTTKQMLEQIPKQIDKQNFCLCLLTVCLTKKTTYRTDIVQSSLVELLSHKVIICGDNFICQKRMYADFIGEKTKNRKQNLFSLATENQTEKGFLFLITDRNAAYKVGVTTNIKERLYRLRTKNQNSNLQIVHEIPVEDINSLKDVLGEHFENPQGFDLCFGNLSQVEQTFVHLFVNNKTDEQTDDMTDAQTEGQTNASVSNYNYNSSLNNNSNSIVSSINSKEERKKNKEEEGEKNLLPNKQNDDRQQTESRQIVDRTTTEMQQKSDRLMTEQRQIDDRNKTEIEQNSNRNEHRSSATQQHSATSFQKNPAYYPTLESKAFLEITPHYLALAEQKFFLGNGVHIPELELKAWYDLFCKTYFNGEKYYPKPTEAFKHFVNWMATQKPKKILDAAKEKPANGVGKNAPVVVKDLSIYNKALRKKQREQQNP